MKNAKRQSPFTRLADHSRLSYFQGMSTWPVAVVFDFDGVIVNSEPLHFQAFREVLAKEDIDLTEAEYYRDLIGFDDRGAVRQVFATRERPLDPPTMLRVLAKKSRAMMESIRRRDFHALPGVEAFVRGLWRKHPLAICSGALREEIETMLEGISLRDCFSVIVAAEDVTRGKPDPEGYLLAIKQLEAKAHRTIAPKDCLIVEDAPAVVKSVRAVGFPVLAVTTSYSAGHLTEANWVTNTLDPAEVLPKIPKLKLDL